ncbi:LytR/AlgR family response regulator transcription factor [Bombilactobacillus bombi]|uniref:LytR/AlgR family response regulator transcription factor n=1 Tax=Bombilactobacillus bombi TaxID=1303590 RepID=UPI0015E5B516|nr:LytTR family DNA-binding domain-containing protein [Bombilactobacillus bombi]MBA1434950.1 response regulator transcription factor [Bombilactobacillus bombi]
MLLTRIIEDKHDDYLKIKRQLAQYAFDHNIEIKSQHVDDYAYLLETVKGTPTQIYFIDIQLGNRQNGIQLAQQLRMQQQNIKIIFMSAFPNYVFDTFVVHPEYFLRKPVQYSELEQVLDRIIATIKKQTAQEFMIRSLKDKSSLVLKTLNLKAISLLDSDKRLLKFITTDGDYLAHGRLERYHFLLKNDNFYQSYRNTIVNLDYVQKIEKTNLLLDDGQILPLAGARRPEILKKFIARS